MHTSNRTTLRIRNFGIVAALFLACAGTAQAATVYKCRDADGKVAYQDRACASSQTASQIELLPAPPVAPSPDYGRAERERPSRKAVAARASGKARNEVVSYECRAANGEVFYRHGGCPKTVSAKANASGGKRSRGAASQTHAVSAEALARADVCRRMAAAGAIGRSGHERDDTVSSYERNLGRDPCRRF